MSLATRVPFLVLAGSPVFLPLRVLICKDKRVQLTEVLRGPREVMYVPGV